MCSEGIGTLSWLWRKFPHLAVKEEICVVMGFLYSSVIGKSLFVVMGFVHVFLREEFFAY